MKFPIKDFVSKYDKIRSILRIWSPLLKKSLMKKMFSESWHWIHGINMLTVFNVIACKLGIVSKHRF